MPKGQLKPRLYVVTDRRGPVPQRLVRALSRAHAIRHVASDYSAVAAGADDVLRLRDAGVLVEDAATTGDDE